MKYNIVDFGAKPNSHDLQTHAVQAALDAARNSQGGIVVVPAGDYTVSSLRMYSNTTLYLCSGAKILGSRECGDYGLIEPPAGMELRTDIEMIPQYDSGSDHTHYRRAILSAYGEENISIVGQTDSMIDGQDCFDPKGEEGFRGPHGIFLSNCRNVTLSNYTIQSTGNFMHQLDRCSNVTFANVTMLAGHDGAHIHCCDNVLFAGCTIQSGDDCIAGIDTKNVTIRDCLLNTSCNSLRIGGVNLLVEDCRFVGPGIYPHRLSIPHGKDDKTPLSAGRHNTLFAFNYFCSKTYPPSSPACNWLIRRCTFENIDQFLCYFANDDANLHSGAPLIDIRMEDLEITGLLPPCDIKADPDHPLRIHQDHVSVRFRDGVPCEGRLFGSGCENVWITDC